jgi:hypothetical protein
MYFESRTFWLAKDAAHSEHYQDAFALDPLRGVAAIADGVSSSLFSSQWAKVLTAGVVEQPPPVHDAAGYSQWLGRRRAQWSSSVDTANLAWHQKAKVQQGAQSTLLWVEFWPPETQHSSTTSTLKFRAYAVGDCCLFHARGSQMLRAFPIEQSALFENKPQVLTSIDGKHDEQLAFETLQDHCQVGDVLVLCTDAIGAWALKSLEDGATLLWRDFWNMSAEDWAAYIARLREEQRMRYDDATLVLLRVCDPTRSKGLKPGELLTEAKRTLEDTVSDVTEKFSDKLGGLFDSFTAKRKRRP